MYFETERLIIRPYDKYNDRPFVHRMALDPNVNEFVIWEPPQTDEEVDGLMSRMNYVMVEDSNSIGVGFCRLNYITNGVFNIGYYLDPFFWRRGYAIEIAKGLISNAFNIYNARKVIATCDPNNVKSEKVLVGSGMTLEGLVREDVQLDNGKWRDSLYYSILRKEFNW